MSSRLWLFGQELSPIMDGVYSNDSPCRKVNVVTDSSTTCLAAANSLLIILIL